MTSQNTANALSLLASLDTDLPAGRAIADLIAERLAPADIAVSLFDAGGGRWRVEIHFGDEAAREPVRDAVAAAAGAEAAAALQFGAVQAADWVRQSLAGLRPVAAGRFVVHGAHDRARIPKNRIGIEIEAALAFGTGHHGTTRGCLVALDAVCKGLGRQKIARTSMRVAGTNRLRPFRGMRSNISGRHRRSILDVGTGSGVLAIAAARALRRFVLATDIDRDAVQVTEENAEANGVGPLVHALTADGMTHPGITRHAPYDLIIANILAGPLTQLAPSVCKALAKGGMLVLSGLLTWQENLVVSFYTPHGLILRTRRRDGPWSALRVMDADGSNVKTLIDLPKTILVGGRVAWKP